MALTFGVPDPLVSIYFILLFGDYVYHSAPNTTDSRFTDVQYVERGYQAGMEREGVLLGLGQGRYLVCEAGI